MGTLNKCFYLNIGKGKKQRNERKIEKALRKIIWKISTNKGVTESRRGKEDWTKLKDYLGG